MTLREQLYERCRGYCEKCGWPLGSNWAMHHRRLRSQGGKDEISNVLAAGHNCHNLATDSIHLNPEQSYNDGYLVSAEHDPKEIPILLRGHTWALLTPEGGYRYI